MGLCLLCATSLECCAETYSDGHCQDQVFLKVHGCVAPFGCTNGSTRFARRTRLRKALSNAGCISPGPQWHVCSELDQSLQQGCARSDANSLLRESSRYQNREQFSTVRSLGRGKRLGCLIHCSLYYGLRFCVLINSLVVDSFL